MTQAWNLSQLGNKVNTSGQLDAATGLVNATLVANGGTGLTTLTANNVILGNGTSAPTFVAPSTAGNILTSNGTTWTSVAQTGFLSKLITDSTDIALGNFITPAYSTIGSSFSVNIPSNGIIKIAGFSGRILNDATASNHSLILGIRILSINYWFTLVNNNGTLTSAQTVASSATSNGYVEYNGLVGNSSGSNVGSASAIDVVGAGISSGVQTIQLIGAWLNNSITLKGTIKQTRVTLEFEG